jgi:hypothetical protein
MDMNNNQLFTNPTLWSDFQDNEGIIPPSGTQAMQLIHLWIKDHVDFFDRFPWIGMYLVNKYLYYKLGNRQFIYRGMAGFKYYRDREIERAIYRARYGYDC